MQLLVRPVFAPLAPLLGLPAKRLAEAESAESRQFGEFAPEPNFLDSAVSSRARFALLRRRTQKIGKYGKLCDSSFCAFFEKFS